MNQEIDWLDVSKKLKNAFTEIERGVLKNSTKEALRVKADKGQHCGSIPFGFKMIDKELVRDENEHKVIALIQQMKADGAKLQAIADELNNQGISTKRGTKWYPSSVKRLSAS